MSNLRKIVIPHPASPDQHITGILELKTPPASSASSIAGKDRKTVALIMHGVMGHKDYLYHKSLARTLPQDSFRFDFRGNHESPGPWSMARFDRDVEDLIVVAKHLREVEGYEIDMVIGHSRGALVSCWWLSNDPTELKLKQIKRFVHICGRWRMNRIHDRDPDYAPFFLADKPFPWKVRVAGKEVVGQATREDVEEFAAFDNGYAYERLPDWLDVLNIGGGKDTVCPPFDVILWQRAFQSRAKTACLHIIEEGDHNLTGFHPEVVEVVTQWSALVQSTGQAPALWDPSRVAPPTSTSTSTSTSRPDPSLSQSLRQAML